MDKISAERRSENMRRIRSKGMQPELLVRSLLHRMGYRYSLHNTRLPGRPDLVFGPRRKAIFVHGCFWHQHSECREGRLPHSRKDYWYPKLTRNVERDRQSQATIRALGWKSLVVWECELKNLDRAVRRILTFLGPPGAVPKGSAAFKASDLRRRIRGPRTRTA